MATKKLRSDVWYYKDIIVPWSSKETASYMVVTEDPSREREVIDKCGIQLAVKSLLENLRKNLLGDSYPTKVNYYIVKQVDERSVFVSKYVFSIDSDSVNSLTESETKEFLKGNGEKLFKQGKIRIKVRGMSIDSSNFSVEEIDLNDIGKGKKYRRLPLPVPMKVQPPDTPTDRPTLIEIEKPSDIGVVPTDIAYYHLLKEYEFGPNDTSTVTVYTGVKLNEGVYDERRSLIYLAKNVAKSITSLVKSNAFIGIIPDESFVPSGVRAITRESFLSVPSREDIKKRLELLVKTFKKKGRLPKNFEVTEELVDNAVGLTLDEVESATRESILLYGTIEKDIFRDMKIKKLSKMNVRYVEPAINFKLVGGMDILKKEVMKNIVRFLKNPNELEEFGIKSSRGFLLAGIGGTGKTWFVNALAGEVGRPVIQLDAADFMSKYVGESEHNLRKIIKIAEELNAFVFIDEIDALGQKRENVVSTDSGVSRRIINMIMEWLGSKDRKAIVIGATNLVQDLDTNFIRAGRFDRIYYVSPPDEKAREQILKLHAKILNPPKGKIKIDDEIFSKVAKETYLWTGAELATLVNDAKIIAANDNAKELKYEHFKKAMENMRINIEKRKAEIERDIKVLNEIPEGVISTVTIKEAERIISGNWMPSKTEEEITTLPQMEGIGNLLPSEDDEELEEANDDEFELI